MHNIMWNCMLLVSVFWRWSSISLLLPKSDKICQLLSLYFGFLRSLLFHSCFLVCKCWCWIAGSDRGLGLVAQNRPPFRPIPAPGLPVVKPDLGPAVVYKPVTRPPLAGPYAFSRIPPPVWNKPQVFLMHDIASTWLFTNFSSGYGDVLNAEI
jgi:hypothetical protein